MADFNKCILTKNDCYKEGRKIKPAGIIVHSTGANNPNLRRYVQPDDGILGKNSYNNDWNRAGLDVCVHGFIGKDKNGKVRFYQTLPFDYRSWGCGAGSNGSYNNSYIQFEICEDDLTNEKYFNEAFKVAVEVCNELIKQYNIDVKNVVSHHEACLRGYASNHGDCDHWLAKFNKNMDWFRKQLTAKSSTTNNTNTTSTGKRVNIAKNVVYYKEAGTIKDAGVYTIVEEKNGMGKLKSGAGWVNLANTKTV